MGCCESRSNNTEDKQWLKEGDIEAQPKWKSVMNLGIHRNTEILPLSKREEDGKAIRLSEIQANILGVPIPLVELLSEMVTLESCIQFYLSKTSFSLNEGYSEVDLTMIVDPLFIKHSAQVNLMGVLINDHNGKEEHFTSNFVLTPGKRTFLIEIKTLGVSFSFRIFYVGARDHEVQYDAEEEYNKRIVEILESSAKAVTDNLLFVEKLYPMMSKAYRKLVNLESFAQEIKGVQQQWEESTILSIKTWNVHHVYPCASIYEMEDGQLIFVMIYNKDSDRFDCLNIRWVERTLVDGTVI